MKRALAVLALAGIAGAASAQSTIHWYWVVGDTGNNDGVISPGENATLNLYAQFSAPGLHYGICAVPRRRGAHRGRSRHGPQKHAGLHR